MPGIRPYRRSIGAFGAGLILAAAVAVPLLAQTGDYTPVLRNCPPCLSVVNTFIRADVDPTGKWVEGTTGGDPGTVFDDNRRLLYGYNAGGTSLVGTSFTTIRVRAGAFITDFIAAGAVNQYAISAAGMCPPSCAAPCPPECNAVVTVWDVAYPSGTVRVTETLETADNPFSGRRDVIRASYDAHNMGTGSPEVGIRTLLDVRVGDNDGAPYIIPGIGNLTLEREFTGADVPAFWLAFESPTYETDRLRAVGILEAEGVDRPDRFIVGRWGMMQTTRWTYTVDPLQFVTSDSAVALYWDPTVLPAGESRVYRTAYGVAGNRGGGAFLSSPVNASCDPFTVALFVSNFEATPLTGGVAQLQLPAGLMLGAGETVAKPLPDIDPGDTASVEWQVQPSGGASGTLTLTAQAAFDGDKEFQATADITVDCNLPSPTPSPSPTATSTPSATISASPTATASEPATPTGTSTLTSTPAPSVTVTPSVTPQATPSGNVCPFILGRVPAQNINVALAQPERVIGWNTRCFRNRPPSPFNGLRVWLSLRNIAVPYDRLHNPVVFKCGCP